MIIIKHYNKLFGKKILKPSVAGVCSVESWPSNPAARVWYPAGDYNFCPGTGCVSFVCVLSCVVSGGGPDILLTTDFRETVLVCLSSVLVKSLCSSYRHLTHEHLGCKTPGSVNPI